MDKKKIIFSIVFVLVFLISKYNYILISEYTDYTYLNSEILYVRLRLGLKLPFYFMLIYVYFSLRKSLVFKVLMWTTIIILISSSLNIILGTYSANNIFMELSNILSGFIIFVILFGIAIYKREKILTILYLLFGILPVYEFTSFINNFSYSTGLSRVELGVYRSNLHLTIAFIGLIILLTIFYKNNLRERKYNI